MLRILNNKTDLSEIKLSLGMQKKLKSSIPFMDILDKRQESDFVI